MFKRLLYEDWQSLIPIAAFVLTFAGFLYFAIRAFFMDPKARRHMSSLPLDFDERRIDRTEGNFTDDPFADDHE